ncbi:hypothetical protein CLU79DRAFT_732734, partial [Phycomyces nitens]
MTLFSIVHCLDQSANIKDMEKYRKYGFTCSKKNNSTCDVFFLKKNHLKICLLGQNHQNGHH